MVSTILPQLHHKESRERAVAVEWLKHFGVPQADKALPELLPLLDDSDADVRRTVAEALATLWLFLAQKQPTQPAYKILLHRLGASESRLNARYRGATVLALACWYNAGFPEDKLGSPSEAQDTANSTTQPDPRAQEEHQVLQKALEDLCYNETRLWLRSAACQVWSAAYRLRLPPS